MVEKQVQVQEDKSKGKSKSKNKLFLQQVQGSKNKNASQALRALSSSSSLETLAFLNTNHSQNQFKYQHNLCTNQTAKYQIKSIIGIVVDTEPVVALRAGAGAADQPEPASDYNADNSCTVWSAALDYKLDIEGGCLQSSELSLYSCMLPCRC